MIKHKGGLWVKFSKTVKPLISFKVLKDIDVLCQSQTFLVGEFQMSK